MANKTNLTSLSRTINVNTTNKIPKPLVLYKDGESRINDYVEPKYDEKKYVKLFNQNSTLNNINNDSEFTKYFNLFTEGQLNNIKWDNVLVAGGSVLACL